MIDRQIQSHFHLFAKYDIYHGYNTFCKQMEVGLYLPVYRRSFRGGNSIFSPWRLSCFVTKLFIYNSPQKFSYTLSIWNWSYKIASITCAITSQQKSGLKPNPHINFVATISTGSTAKSKNTANGILTKLTVNAWFNRLSHSTMIREKVMRAKQQVNTTSDETCAIVIYIFIMSYLPRSTPSVRSTVLPGAPALHAWQNKHQSAYNYIQL